MTETNLSQPQNSGSSTNLPPTASFPPGTKFSNPISAQASHESPDLPRTHTTSDAGSNEQEKDLGPSAFEGTAQPFLARLFGINTTEIAQLELGKSLAEVDTYILGLVKERNWVDTVDSYNRVLSELRANLGIDPSLQPLIALGRLAKGVSLLRLQQMHRRRDAQIQAAINKINTKT